MTAELVDTSQWIDLYAQKLYSRARFLMKNHSDAEDLVQDVFVAAFEGIESFQGKSSVETWLMAILNRKAADFYRKKYKSGTEISLTDFFDGEDCWKDADRLLRDWDNVDFQEENFEEYLAHCMEHLPQKWLLIVKLTYISGCKSDEVCSETEVTKTNYWKILQRSRLQLRECIEKKL